MRRMWKLFHFFSSIVYVVIVGEYLEHKPGRHVVSLFVTDYLLPHSYAKLSTASSVALAMLIDGGGTMHCPIRRSPFDVQLNQCVNVLPLLSLQTNNVLCAWASGVNR